MARRDALETLLSQLADVARAPDDAAGHAVLREALAGRQSVAAARAAEIVGEAELHEFEEALTVAFDRFMETPVKRDPGCLAKAAIAEALHQLDARCGALYLVGARHVQMEPVYGGRADTAAPLRAAAARGLVRMNHPDALLVLSEALADAEAPVRLAAARTLAHQGSDAALPLLRLKALVGDEETEVVGECLLAVLRIAPEDQVPFVERFLAAEDAVLAEAAALALGESRSPAALAVLQQHWRDTSDPDRSRSALLAIAMHRSDDAIRWLLERVAQETGPLARDAIDAFEVYRNEEAMVERVRAAAAREDVDLTGYVDEVLG